MALIEADAAGGHKARPYEVLVEIQALPETGLS
jgi:hypothetical protein